MGGVGGLVQKLLTRNKGRGLFCGLSITFGFSRDMISALIGGVLGAAGSLFGGYHSKRAMDRVRGDLARQKADNESWYNRRMYEDSTMRADALRAMTRAGEEMRRRNQAAAGSVAVMGGTDAASAAVRQANAEALADAASRIAVAGEQRKDGVESDFRTRDQSVRQKELTLDLQSGQEMGKAATGLAQAGTLFASAFE